MTPPHSLNHPRLRAFRFLVRLLTAQRVQRQIRKWLGKGAERLLLRIRHSALLARLNYLAWMEFVEAPELKRLDVQSILSSLERKPLISVVMPTWNTPPKLLRKAIESVRAQSYPEWELCIADDASTHAETLQLLRDYAEKDPRIKVTFRSENGHISAASNSALALAGGEFVALLDHDDELAEHALLFAAQAIVGHDDVQLIYPDEDKIDGRGWRVDPHFKPQWNPDLLLSINYICHLALIRRSLLQQIGGFRIGVEGSQDHDLLLRCLPHLRTDQVVHIPHILYHWRILPGSTAQAASAKSYTVDAGLRAVRDYLAACGPSGASVEPGLVANTYRIRYALPALEPLVSILIPTRDRLDLLRPCVEGVLQRTDYRNLELLILDNQSVEAETHAWLAEIQRQDGRVRVLAYDHPFNYSAINNFGAREAKGEVLLLLNNDIEPINGDWLREMVAHAVRPEIGCVGAKLYFDDDTIQHGGVLLGICGIAGHAHKFFPRSHPGYARRLICTQNYVAVTGACLALRKALFDEVGGLNERELTVALNDVDLCLKVHALGYRNLWTPFAELYHYESKSRGADSSPEKAARLAAEVDYLWSCWRPLMQNDPGYSPNLTRDFENFGLRIES